MNENEVKLLCWAEPRKVLQTAVEKRVSAIMSYFSSGKWHVAKVQPTGLGADTFEVEILPCKKPHPMNVKVGQLLGISLKYGYGKFIFETKIERLEPSRKVNRGGRIALSMPDRINVVQRRSYFRVKVPESLSVEVQLWHCTGVKDKSKLSASSMRPESVGRLVDLSAGGMQIAISAAQKPKFKEGRFVSVKFVAMPSEKPLMFNARIRTVFPTADEKNFSIGLQIVGLEANAEGQEVLSKLIGITEQYYQMSNSGLGRQEMPPVHA
jgi:hypothetical protein